MASRQATSPADVADAVGSTLSVQDETLLDFERRHSGTGRAKDAAIRSAFDISPAAYYVRLSRIIDSPEAMAYDPLLVQRLQRRVAASARWHAGADR